MKTLLALFVLVPLGASADTVIPAPLLPGRDVAELILRDGTRYRDVHVLSLTETTLRIHHQRGVASVPLSLLLPEDAARTGLRPAPAPGISAAMTPEERQRTGIDKLSPAEQERLQDWIVRSAESYESQKAATAAPSPPPPPIVLTYPAPPPVVPRAGPWLSGPPPLPSHNHYITAKYRGQEPKIQLEDDTLWEVSPAESYTMFLWQPAEEISLIEGDDPNYPVTMVNLSQGRSVSVRLAGR